MVGIPFDTGTSYRPGARFGPVAVRQGSRLLRPYHPDLEVRPFDTVQVIDAGDVACTPFDINEAVAQIEEAVDHLLDHGTHIVALPLPLLRATAKRHGPVALVHFDVHLDIWDSYFGARYTHGTPFSRAREESLLLPDRAAHIGTRGPLYGSSDLEDDDRMQFWRVSATEVGDRGVSSVVRSLRERIGSAPIYVSVDIDVLDPAHAPGTGTPEAGGLTSRDRDHSQAVGPRRPRASARSSRCRAPHAGAAPGAVGACPAPGGRVRRARPAGRSGRPERRCGPEAGAGPDRQEGEGNGPDVRGMTTAAAAAQVTLNVGDVVGNRSTGLDAIAAAADRGAQMVVLPELSDTGYVFTDRAEAEALADPDTTLGLDRRGPGGQGQCRPGQLAEPRSP